MAISLSYRPEPKVPNHVRLAEAVGKPSFQGEYRAYPEWEQDKARPGEDFPTKQPSLEAAGVPWLLPFVVSSLMSANADRT